MKSKFKIIFLTMFFLLTFGVLAYADDEQITLPQLSSGYSNYNYIVLIDGDSKGSYYFVYFSPTPPVVDSSNRLVHTGKFLESTCYKGKPWRELSENKQDKYTIALTGDTKTKYTNFDLKKSDGSTFFQKTQVYWWSMVNLGGMLTQVRPVAIIAGGFLVLVIALRKGFSLLKTVLKGL